MPLAIGDKLGHYEVLSLLGQGGMGEVYRARDTRLKRDVAIKVLPAALAHDPERMARFEREARLLASLDHANIGAIYGLEESNGTRALILALIEGPTLADRIAAGAIPLDEVIHMAQQMAEALEYAHDRGVIHRDLKPANVKITPEGTVKVLDFGLAKALTGESDTASGSPANSPTMSPTLSMRPTQVGMILGTAAYMAPEQAKGKTVDRRADIWAFGVVMFEMLTCEHLFTGDTAAEIMASALKEEPKLDRLPRSTPPVIRRLIERCLNKDPKQRLQAIGEARIVLSGPMQETATASTPASSRSRLGVGAWASAMLTVVAAVGLTGWWRTAHPPDPPLKTLIRLDADLGAEVSPSSGEGPTLAIAPDGSRLVLVTPGSDGKDHLALRLLDNAQTTALANTEGAANPVFSPDSRWVAFFAGGKLKKISVEGGKVVTLCDARNPRGASWGEDGNIVFASENRSALSRVSSSGGDPQPATELDVKNGEVTNRYPQVLPGGEAFLFQARTDQINNEEATIQVQSIKTGQRKTLVKGGSYAHYLPSGHLVYMHLRTMYAAPMDLKRLELTGPASPVIEDLRSNPNGYAYFDFTPAGTLVYIAAASTGERSLSWLDASGALTPARLPPGHYTDVRVSPDGNRLALLASDGGGANLSMYDWAQDRILRVASFKNAISGISWARDSKHLVFDTERNQLSGPGIYWMRADGAGEPQRLLEGAGWVLASAAPDGKWLGYWSRVPPYGLWTLPLDLADPEHPKPGKPEPLLKSDVEVRGPTFSPDGHWAGYTSFESGKLETYVRPFPGPGGKWQVSTEGGGLPQWLANRQELFYYALDRRIRLVDYNAKGDSFAAGRPRLWSEKAPRAAFDALDLTPDGKRFAVLVPTLEGEIQQPTRVVFLLNFFDELRRRVPVSK